MDTAKNLGWKVAYIVFVACFLFGTTQSALAQDEEPKKKGLEKKVFVVPEFDANKKNENVQQNRVKVKSMTPELLDDPWADKLEEERDREIEEQAKKDEEEKEALEMGSEMDKETKTEIEEENKNKEDIPSEEYKEKTDSQNPKKTEKSTKKD